MNLPTVLAMAGTRGAKQIEIMVAHDRGRQNICPRGQIAGVPGHGTGSAG